MKFNKKTDQAVNHTIIFGIHSVIEVLKAKKRKILHIYTTNPFPKSFKEIQALLPGHVLVTCITKDGLTKLAGTDDHQGVVAHTTAFVMQKKCFDPKNNPCIVLIDGVQDTRNLGGILRSVHCTGANGVVIPEKNNASLTGATFKASAGLAEHLAVWQPSTAIQAAQELKAAGYNLYMAALGGVNALNVEYKLPLCIVIGNEATGVSREVLALGTKIMLPQKNADISYNASVAAGIILFLIATKTHRL